MWDFQKGRVSFIYMNFFKVLRDVESLLGNLLDKISSQFCVLKIIIKLVHTWQYMDRT